MNKPGDRRYTITTVRAGQPGPYQDTEYVYRVLFESVPWFGVSREALPCLDLTPDHVRDMMNGLQVGIGPKTPSRTDERDWFDAYIDYIKPVPDHPGTWELRTVSPFTD